MVSKHCEPLHTIKKNITKVFSIVSKNVTLPEAFITPANETPPLPELTTSGTKEIEMIKGEALELAYEKIGSRRRLLLSLIQDDGWEWDDLQAGSYNHEITK